MMPRVGCEPTGGLAVAVSLPQRYRGQTQWLPPGDATAVTDWSGSWSGKLGWAGAGAGLGLGLVMGLELTLQLQLELKQVASPPLC
jgi:hypothetical protein